MNDSRLIRLAEELEKETPTPPSVGFNMAYWFDKTPNSEVFPGCGTTCCAFGLACLIPEFRAEGLVIDKYRRPCLVPKDEVANWVNGETRLPTSVEMEDNEDNTHRYANFNAAAVFFGLSSRQAYMLFDPAAYEDEYPDMTDGEDAPPIRPADVARRIRAMVAGTYPPADG